jgi:hypothetical protein
VLSILYPHDDYTAADIAMRVRALAAGENRRVQVMGGGRYATSQKRENQIDRTQAALLIARIGYIVDEEVVQSVLSLRARRRRVVCLLPQSFTPDLFDPGAVERYVYEPNDPRTLGRITLQFSTELATSKSSRLVDRLLVASVLWTCGILAIEGQTSKAERNVSSGRKIMDLKSYERRMD